MTTVTTRVNKTSELTYGEGDANIDLDVKAKAVTHLALLDDNRAVYECSGTFNFTLDAIATLLTPASTFNNDFTITIKNAGSGIITVLTTGADTLDGIVAPGTKAIPPGKAYEYKANAAGDGWLLINDPGEIIGQIRGVITAHGSATSLAVDFSTFNFMNTITGGAGTFTFTGINYTAGASLEILVTADGTERDIVFPTNWTFVGYKPATITASSKAILALRSYTTADTGVIATWVET